jgi:16S rRNA (cytidine1402-2'-O)-methyltransferase
MKEFLGERQILVAKEITKIHENIIKGTLDDILDKVKSVILKGR